MIDIKSLQDEHREWLERNFPGQLPHQPVLGMFEEAGELAHAQLKLEQGIRGDKELHIVEAKDAVGDIFIYMMSYANTMGWDLEEILYETWGQVKKRNWADNPRDGISA